MDRQFDFVVVNPTLSGMLFAAEAEGGTCVGVARLRASDRDLFEKFHGIGGARGQQGRCDVVLAEIPFSLFAGDDVVDPAVADVVEAAAKAAHGSASALFRVPWEDAAVMGVVPSEYEAAVRTRFPDAKWRLDTAVTDDGGDLFILARKTGDAHGEAALPAKFPAKRPRGKLNPQDFLVACGYPEPFALLNKGAHSRIVETAVLIANARVAVASAISTVGARA